jgi:DNA-binding MarR family transcriptional regulator
MSKQRRAPDAGPARRNSRRTAPNNAGSPAVGSPLAGSPSFLVRLAQLRAFDEFHQQFAGLGVTPAGFSVLTLIVANPGVRPGAIAEELRVKPSNVAALVNALAAAGLVERTPDASELRANLLHATKKGLGIWKEMDRSRREADARFVERLSAPELERLVALLRKLLHR